jgi:hypothetical protein
MGDGNSEHLAYASRAGERRVAGFNAEIHRTTDEAEAAIAQNGTRKQAGFEKNLKSVADAENEPASGGEALNRAHHRGKTSDGAGAEIITVGKTARENDGINAGQILGLVPQHLDRLLEDATDRVPRVVIAIGPGKDDDAEFHERILSCQAIQKNNRILGGCNGIKKRKSRPNDCPFRTNDRVINRY